MATFIKLTKDGLLIGVDKLDPPVWVKQNPRTGDAFECSQKEAQGVLDSTFAVTYQLDGKPPFDDPRIDTTATIITEAEYDELVAELHPPDVDPEPDPEPEPEPVDPGAMSNAELTAAVKALTEELAAAKIMLGVE